MSPFLLGAVTTGLNQGVGPSVSSMTSVDRSTTAIPAVTCSSTTIKTVTQARLLGVTVDDQLSWKEHVNHLYRKIACKIVCRSSGQLTPTAGRQFFISVIQPDFEYAASTFVPTMSAAQKNRLLGLWRKAIRCTASATWHCAVGPLLVELRLSNIEHLWALLLALMVQKCHLGTAPQDICKKLNSTKHSHETRGNQSCFTPFHSLTNLAQSVSQIVLPLSGTFFLNLFVRAHILPPFNLTFSTLSSNHEIFLLYPYTIPTFKTQLRWASR